VRASFDFAWWIRRLAADNGLSARREGLRGLLVGDTCERDEA